MASVPEIKLNGGTTIPQLGFGVWRVSAEDIVPSVSEALAAGYRHIDTAAIYGNEDGVGRAIAASGVDRDELFVTTKLWNTDQGHDAALRAFDASLDRLGLEYVDLYLIHWPCPARDLYVETFQALLRLHEEGRARAVGVSNFRVEDLRRLVDETGVVPAVNQIELHPSFQQPELRALHAELGVVTEAWSPLGQSQDLDDPAIGAIATAHGVTPAQVVIRWHLQLGNVVIPKSVTPARIRSNFDVLGFELTAGEMAEIAALDRAHRIGRSPSETN